jgi:hypothetical protein
MRSLVVVVLVLGACAGDAPPDTGSQCNGLLYDSCLSEHDCTSGMCKNFMGDGIQVCSQACDAVANPCPMQNGVAVTCNPMGVCKPAAANLCTAQ